MRNQHENPTPSSVPPRSGGRRHRAVAVRIAAVVVGSIALVVATLSPAAAEDYVVEPGDSLSEIARDSGVTTQELASANGISDLHVIRVGQVLTIPRQVYVVQSGDYLSVIARETGVSQSELMRLNGIANPNRIQVGMELRLPSGAQAGQPANPAAGYNRLPERLRANPERLELIPSFERWAAHYDVPADLLMAVAYRESGWQTSVVSNKGAIGVGQLLPTTAEWVAEHLIGQPLDPNVADDNIRMSARFLDWLFGYMGSEDDAIAAYYQGPGSVRARGYYLDTQAYVDNIGQIRGLFVKS